MDGLWACTKTNSSCNGGLPTFYQLKINHHCGCSISQISFKQSKLLSYPILCFNHSSSRALPTIQQNATCVSCSTEDQNLAEIKTFGRLGLRKQFVPKSQTQWFNRMLGQIKDEFVSLLHLKSLKKEPRNIPFDELMGVDDIILEFHNIISKIHGKSQKIPNGVLLYGPPGTGKNTLVHAMAWEARVPFFCVSACYIAGGDVNITNLFNEAKRCSPSIVYIRHLESDPYLVQLQKELEKCNKDGSMVVVIAATDALDPALMGSHLFYKTFHVAEPDEDCKLKKARLYLKDYVMEEDKEAICKLVASQTSGATWALLEEITVDARYRAIGRGGDHVTMDDVRHAVRRFNTRMSLMTKMNENP